VVLQSALLLVVRFSVFEVTADRFCHWRFIFARVPPALTCAVLQR
jgi:hypothetical protein